MLVSLGVAVTLLLLGLILLIHHGIKHMKDDPSSKARVEGIAWLCYFQLKDISNHETWILICWSNAATILILINTI